MQRREMANAPFGLKLEKLILTRVVCRLLQLVLINPIYKSVTRWRERATANKNKIRARLGEQKPKQKKNNGVRLGDLHNQAFFLGYSFPLSSGEFPFRKKISRVKSCQRERPNRMSEWVHGIGLWDRHIKQWANIEDGLDLINVYLWGLFDGSINSRYY